MGLSSECSGSPVVNCAYNASPAQPNITVSAFFIDTNEVTVARFRAWVNEGQPTPGASVTYPRVALPFEGTVNSVTDLNPYAGCNWGGGGREEHPMNCVNWATAQAFCVWDGGRLPTQAEWELVARGSGIAPRAYPWGNAPPDDTLTCWSGAGQVRVSTCPVGANIRGAVDGVHNLAGNVWEWNADWYEGYVSGASDGGVGCWTGAPRSDPLCAIRSATRVIRGGSWGDTTEAYLRAPSRFGVSPANRYDYLGFRCARGA